MNVDESECRNQVLRFFRYLDERNYDALAGILDTESLWYRQGKALRGASAALEALDRRSTTMRIVHLISNLMVDESGPTHCRMRGYMLIVRHDSGETASGASPLNGIESIRDLHVLLSKHGSKWLIKELSGEDILFAQEK